MGGLVGVEPFYQENEIDWGVGEWADCGIIAVLPGECAALCDSVLAQSDKLLPLLREKDEPSDHLVELYVSGKNVSEPKETCRSCSAEWQLHWAVPA